MIKMIGKISDIVGQRGIIFLREDGWFLVLLMILNLPIFIQEFLYFSRIFPSEEGLKNALPNFWQGACFILLLCVAMNFLFAKHRRIKNFSPDNLDNFIRNIFVDGYFSDPQIRQRIARQHDSNRNGHESSDS